MSPAQQASHTSVRLWTALSLSPPTSASLFYSHRQSLSECLGPTSKIHSTRAESAEEERRERSLSYFVDVVFAHAFNTLELTARFAVNAFDAGASLFGFGFGKFDQLITAQNNKQPSTNHK